MSFSARMGRVLAAALLLHGIESQAQSFTNGGFEMVTGAPISPGSSMTLNAGDTWLPGWSAGGPDGSVMVQNGVVGFYEGSDLFGLAPWEGQQWVIFPNDTLGGSLSQTFGTTIGGYCTVSFVAAYVFSADAPLLSATVQASNGSVLTNSLSELSYRQWTSNQISFIATTTNTTLTFSDASANAEGAYLGLDDVVLVAEPPGWPYIITSPASITNAAGTQVTFTASAGGNPSTVQWCLGTNVVSGATNTTLAVIANVTNAGSYTAVFSNSLGTNASKPAILTVLQVVTSPASQSVNAGAVVGFSAAANLSGATVQWFLGPNPIPFATTTSLAVTAGNQTAGSYTAQFSIGTVTAISGAALLIVSNIPFVNGGFEMTKGLSIPSGSDLVANVGGTWLTGWDIGGTNDEVFVFNGPFLGVSAADGNQWVVFDSENSPPAGTVSQTFSTRVGQSYLVTFAAVALYDEGTPFKSLSAAAVAFDGSVLASTNVDPTASWSTNQLAFTATTINTTLVLTDISPAALGPSVGLDAVTVVAETPPSLAVQALQPASGTIVFQVSGKSGQSYVLQTSTNLVAWSPVLTNSLLSPTIVITNTVIPGANQQFWKAISAP